MHLLHIFPSFQVGGSQRRFAALANHFAARPLQFTHTVISLDGCREAKSLLAPGIPCTFAGVGPKGHSLANIINARRRIAELRPDLLVTYNWGSIDWAAANTAVRHVHIEDGFGPEEAHRQLRRRAWFRRLVLNRNSTVVLPSQTLVRIALTQWHLNPARLIHLPNGISCSRFFGADDAGLRERLGAAGPVIGTVAGLRREKALDRMIRAFSQIRSTRPAHLVIVGDGAERPGLEQLVKTLGVQRSVTFTGALAAPERAMAAFDIFAISSDTEQMPLSVLEAMAAGHPIAATDAGDIASMVAEENRRFIMPKTDEALAHAMAALLDDGDLRRRLGTANRARALATFDESRMFNAYERIFLGDDPPVQAARSLTAAPTLSPH